MGIKFSIITPTYNRDVNIVKRCIESVNGQSYTNWEHIVISDCESDEEDIKTLCDTMPHSDKRIYVNTGNTNSNTWGAYPRQYGMMEHATGDYYLFLDDDNIILSHALRVAQDTILLNDNIKALVWSIYHNGALNPYVIPEATYVNTNPKLSYILQGNPPHKYNVDTLNIIIRGDIIKSVGWVCNVGNEGYCNDGDTYDKIFKIGVIPEDEIIYVPEVLGIHV